MSKIFMPTEIYTIMIGIYKIKVYRILSTVITPTRYRPANSYSSIT